MKILMLLKSSLDNDSRVIKEIKSLKLNGISVSLLSVNTKQKYEIERHISINYNSRRLLIPGLSSIVFNYIFIKGAFSAYSGEDVVHCHDFNTLFAGVLLKLFRRWNVKIVYDSHEFAINTIPNQGNLSIYITKKIEGILINFTDEVINVSEAIARQYKNNYNIRMPKVIKNCPNYCEISKQDYFRKYFNLRADQFIYLYQGGLSDGRGIEIMLDAFANLKNEDCVLIIMGSGKLENLVRSKISECANIFLHRPVMPNELIKYTSSADCGVLPYEDNCLNHRYCAPNKFFEYLMAGIPVLATNLEEMKYIVESEGIGVIAEQNTAEGIREAAKSLINLNLNLIKMNIMRVRKKFCWEEEEKILINLYKELYETYKS